jgi:cyclase
MFSGGGKEIFQRAKNIGNRETHAEDILWGDLKTSPTGYKFRRQHLYSNYILDFYCHQLKLVIEVDGQFITMKRSSKIILNGKRFWKKRFICY